MNVLTKEQTATVSKPSEAIREVCQQELAEPAHIWEVLEAKGITVTPGVIHQAIADLDKPQQKATDNFPPTKVLPDHATGLTVQDMELLATLAERVGGIDQLVHLLTLMQ